jgi:hypothetical protein
MGLTLQFADSFAHYNQSGLPLKWSIAGGTIDNTVARTGPQSLKIQSTGASPNVKIGDFFGASYNVVGFGWRTSSLAGETIVELYEAATTNVQLYLVQNANGSISLFSGSAGLLGTSPAGTLTLNTWWYIEINTFVNGSSQCIVTVTSSPGGVAKQVINVSGFSTPDGSFDSIVFVGPGGANFGWIADFYAATWDHAGTNPFVTFGAPKIYGLCPPTADSSGYVGYNTVGKTIPFPGNPAPFWSQVNTIPQNTNIGMYETDNNPGGLGWIVCGQFFDFDLSAVVPPNSSIVAAQLVALVAAAADDPSVGPGKGPNDSILLGMRSFNGPNPFDVPIGGSFSAQYYFQGYSYDPPYTGSVFTGYGIDVGEPG